MTDTTRGGTQDTAAYEAPSVTVLGTLVELTQQEPCDPNDPFCTVGSI